MKPQQLRLKLTRKQRSLFLLIISIISILLVIYRDNVQQAVQTPVVSGSYRVTSIADGDTITIDMNGKTETIRFIGVDTPETHDPRKPVQCFGKAASAFMKTTTENKFVRLEGDSLSTNRDRYDRLLRYVYVDDRLLNAEIIKQGYGFANTGFPFTKMKEFREYQQQAKAENKGLWSSCEINELDNGQMQTNDN